MIDTSAWMCGGPKSAEISYGEAMEEVCLSVYIC